MHVLPVVPVVLRAGCSPPCDDKELALAVVQAYNDWHIDEWCGTYPGRFIPMALPVLWDPELCAARVRRVAAKGCHSVTFTENPATLGLPSFHDAHWDPMWRARGGGDDPQHPPRLVGPARGHRARRADRRDDHAAADEHLHGGRRPRVVACSRSSPTLKVALSEGGTGWIPYFLDRLDRTYDMHHLWTGQDFGDRMPSDVFREHILTCFIADPVGLKLRDEIGIDNICWEQDYPHSDSSWPSAPEELAHGREVRRDRRRAQQDHARERDALVPVRPVRAPGPREQCTVGALRAEVAGHDVSIRAMDKGRDRRRCASASSPSRRPHEGGGYRLRDDYSGPVRPRPRARRLLGAAGAAGS